MLADRGIKCGEYHLFDIRVKNDKSKDIVCRCKTTKISFGYIRATEDMTMRVKVVKKSDFRGVD